MKNSKLQFKTQDEVESVFYDAFMNCDSGVMAGLWADEGVVCVHPGAGVIVNYNGIIRSWGHIFSNVQRTDMKYTVINRTASSDLAVHVVAEEFFSSGRVAAIVLATNVYRKFKSDWLMIEHHASLVQEQSIGQTLQ